MSGVRVIVDAARALPCLERLARQARDNGELHLHAGDRVLPGQIALNVEIGAWVGGVCRSDGAPTGFYAAEPVDELLQVRALYVPDRSRRLGVGTALVEHARGIASQRGLSGLEVAYFPTTLRDCFGVSVGASEYQGRRSGIMRARLD